MRRYAISISTTGRKLPAPESRVTRAAIATLTSEKVPAAMVSIAFVGKTRITELNSMYLKHRRPTDVLSFGFRSAGRGTGLIADIYICPEVARENARRQGVPFREEILRIVIHGVLHAIGYDHPDSDARMSSAMWKKQERIVAEFD